MAQMTMIQAITDALAVELKRDENVLIFGEDVGKNGGVFRATQGLQDEFGEDRVFNTPLAESGIGGLAIGLALEGYLKQLVHVTVWVELVKCLSYSVHQWVEGYILQNYTQIT